MGVQEFMLGRGQVLRLDAARGDTVRVRTGNVWLTRYNDPNDHIMKAGHVIPLNDEGPTIIMACRPTLLELHRQDPVDVREKIERRVHSARNGAMRAFFFKFFR